MEAASTAVQLLDGAQTQICSVFKYRVRGFPAFRFRLPILVCLKETAETVVHRKVRPVSHSEQNESSLRKNMLFNTVGSLMYQGCLWIITVLVVVLSDGYTDSGILSFAMTVGNMFTALGTYNMRTFQVSDVKNEYSQGTYVGFRCLTLVIALAVISAYSLIVSPDSLTFAAVLTFLLFKIDESFCDVLYGTDQRGGRMDYIGISQFIRGILVVAAFSMGLIVSHNILIALFALYPMGLLMTIFYDIPHAKRIDAIRPTLTKQRALELLRRCLPLVLETLFIGMIVSVARQYFSNAFGNDQLGIYAAVATPAVLVQAAARYLYAPTLVPLAQQWSESPREAFLPYLKKVLGGIAAAIVVAVPLLALVGPPTLTLIYGQSIAVYTYLFTNVLVCTGAMAILYFLADVLIICRDIKGSLIASIVALASTVATMVPLESLFNMQGINYTILLGTAAGIVSSFVLIKRNPAFKS